MKRGFYGFNNRFRTTKNTEVVVFDMLKFGENIKLIQIK